MKLLSLTHRHFVSKWASQFVATGKNMKRWQFCPHGYCPFCKDEDESTTHILHCTHQDARDISKETLWKFVESMIKIGTCPRAVRAMRDETMFWRDNKDCPDISFLPEILQFAIISQRQIGWRSFLKGLLSTDWTNYQQAYFEDIGSR